MKKKYNFSFAGCGFLGIYHVGVASCIRKYAPELLVNKITGASAGALAATLLLCDAPLGRITSSILKTATEARKSILGPFHPTFNIENLLREGLLMVLPDNAHEIVNGKLFVSVTRVSDGKNILLSHFDSREELVQSLLCSAFIPSFSGWEPQCVKGVRYIDGGFSDNLPQLDDDTITVSPFCGEADICPKDNNAGLLTINLANTSLELTQENFYRFTAILFPSHPKILNEMCYQGFRDALDFLQRSSLINCARCLSIKSTIVVHNEEEREEPVEKVKRHYHTKDCKDCEIQRREAILDSLPEAVGVIFQEAIDSANKGLINWAFRLKSVKLLSLISIGIALPLHISSYLIYRITDIVPNLKNVTKIIYEMINIARLLMKAWLGEAETVLDYKHHSHYKEDFKCELEITEFKGEAEPVQQTRTITDEYDSLNVPVSHRSSMSLESESLNFLAAKCASRSTLLAASRNPSRNPSRAVSRRASIDLSTADSFDLEQGAMHDTFEDIVDVTSHQEALMAYYYMDDNNEMKVTEIFDLTNANNDQPPREEQIADFVESHLQMNMGSIDGKDEQMEREDSLSFSSEDTSEPEADRYIANTN